MGGDPAGISTYDQVNFPSYPHTATRPDRLAAFARLRGLRTASPETCRVLEIGCDAGGNLLPLAELYPQAHWTGLDLSHARIQLAQRRAAQLELSNVEFIAADVRHFDPGSVRYDYIICHGVYSWTTPDAQEAILRCCRELLADVGIGYININTYPGWFAMGLLRDVVRYAAKADADPQEKVRRARQMLDVLQQAATDGSSPWLAACRGEIEAARRASDGYLFHSMINVVNHPLYFDDFCRRLADHDLQYLGDADPAQMWGRELAPRIEVPLAELAANPLEREQYVDFLQMTMSRRCIVCDKKHLLSDAIDEHAWRELHLAAPISHWAVLQNEVQIRTRDGREFRLVDPLLFVLLDRLRRSWPAALPDAELVTGLTAEERSRWYATLPHCVSAGFIEIASAARKCRADLPRRPRTTRLAALQAAEGGPVTNLLHETLRLDPLEYRLLSYLDGQHDWAQLEQHLAQPSGSSTLAFPDMLQRLVDYAMLLDT